MAELNGHAKLAETPQPGGSLDRIAGAFADSQDKRVKYEAETESRRQSFARQMDRLIEQRHEAMSLASEHAGNIGLVYRAASNSFSRVLIVDDVSGITSDRPAHPSDESATPETEEPPAVESPLAIETHSIQTESPTTSPRPSLEIVAVDHPGSEAFLPELPPAPAPPVLPAAPAPPVPLEVDKKWERATTIKSAVAWIASLFIGGFVGFGLLTLTGLPWQRASDRAYLYVFLAIGIGAIAGMKLLFDAIWHEAGRRKVLGAAHWTYTCLYGVLSCAILAIEAFLGGEAIVIYTQRASFEGKGALSLSLAVLLAAAISSANLLFSAFIGYQKGQRSVSADDLQRKAHERTLQDHEELVQSIKDSHARAIEAWELDARRHDELKQRRHESRLKELADAELLADREDNVQEQLHQLRLEAIEDRKVAHQEALTRWRSQQEAVVRAQMDGLDDRATRVDDFESYRKMPDFQALCKCQSLVDVLNHNIDELKRRSDNDAISRGHARKSAV